MSGFEDQFNASGKHKGAGKHGARNKKIIQIAKDGPAEGTPQSLPMQLADEASRNGISRQAKEGWSGIDGFDNATGKKLSDGKKALLIGGAALALAGLVYFITTRMDKKKA